MADVDPTAKVEPYRAEPIYGSGHTVLAADVLREMRQSPDWRQEVDDVLARLGRSLACHRTILFRMSDVYGQGFAQSIFTYWMDVEVLGRDGRPTLISQSVAETDALLEQLAIDLRRGRKFFGHTRDISGFLREDFERQRIRSFLSVPVFAHGYLWGTVAVNDCLREREWTEEEHATMEIVALAVGDAIERSQTEAHISEVFRTTMLQAALDGIVVIDEVGGIIEFNPAAEQMFGWKKGELLGKNIAQTLIPAEHRAAHSSGMKHYMDGGAPKMIGRRIETVARDVHGDTIPIELTIAEVKAAGRILFVGTMRDLRERRRAEDEINRQREKLHQNEKMAAMGSLLAGVSHELNNPLAVVVAQSTLLHEFAADPQTKTRAEKVRAAAERCGRIVKSFLGMVRLHPTAQSETDVNAVVRSALEVTAYGARSSGILIDSDIADAPLTVVGDADHLTQVVANFLVNSQHALAGVSGEKRIRVATAPTPEGMARFLVEDNGPGIPAEIRDRVFESYFTTKPVGVGTGIGLSISRSIVERHNGRVWFEEAPGGGARFVVELPLARSASAQASPEAANPGSLRSALIIDDEPDVASSLADILELMGIKAAIHTQWDTARAAIEAGAEFDIVFSDLRMPGTGGIDIFRAIARLRPRMAARFVLVTGDTIGATVETAGLEGPLRPFLLEKPFSTLDVRGTLAAVTDRASA